MINMAVPHLGQSGHRALALLLLCRRECKPLSPSTPLESSHCKLGKLFNIAHRNPSVRSVRTCAPTNWKSTMSRRRPSPVAKAHIHQRIGWRLAPPTPNDMVVRTCPHAIAPDLGPICSIGGFSLICQNLTVAANRKPACAFCRRERMLPSVIG